MDKIKDFIFNRLQKIIGSSIESFLIRVVIAGLALYTGSATDVGDAVGLALDKPRSIAAAAELINDTPKAEITEAIEAQ